MEPVSFPILTDLTQPIARQNAANTAEEDIAAVFVSVFGSEIASRFIDVMDYGAPVLGSRNVLERVTKQDGLAVLIRDTSDTDYDTTTAIMRAIYASWISLGSERGLAFLQYVIQMLFPDTWTIKRLWHPISRVGQYPRYLTNSPYGDAPFPAFFLTSRIQIFFDETVALDVLSELAPSLRRLVPANIVPTIAVSIPIEDLGVGISLGMYGTMVADLSPFY